MPNISTPIGTTQDYIPAVAPAQIGKFAGLVMVFPTLVALNAAVTKERGNIAASSPIWADGQPMMVADEFIGGGCYRVWRAGLQHARTAMLRNGLNVTLAGDANSLLFEAGAPDAGTGINGDVSIDWAGNAYYTKAAGAWASTGSIYSAGGGIPIPADNQSPGLTIESTDYIDIYTNVLNDAGEYYSRSIGIATGGDDATSVGTGSGSGAIVIRTGNFGNCPAGTSTSGLVTIRSGMADYPGSVIVEPGQSVSQDGAFANIGGGQAQAAGKDGGALNLYGGLGGAGGSRGAVNIISGSLFMEFQSIELAMPSTAKTLTNNGTMTIAVTSNTNLRFAFRGSDGVTRVANITLA